MRLIAISRAKGDGEPVIYGGCLHNPQVDLSDQILDAEAALQAQAAGPVLAGWAEEEVELLCYMLEQEGQRYLALA